MTKTFTFLKGISLLFILLMTGVSGTWAQTVIYANKQMNFRTNSASSPTAWSTGDWANPATNKNGLNIDEVEVNTATTTIFVTEQFVIPNWNKVESISISHNGIENSGGVAIWYFPKDFYESNAYSSDFLTAVNDVLGVYPGNDYSSNSPVIEGAVSGNLSVNDINTKYSSYISNNTLTLNILLTSTAAATTRSRITSAKESNGSNRPYVTVKYNDAVYNKTTNTYYSTLNAAFSALTDADTELEVSSDQILTGRCTWANTSSHSVTITPTADITITANGNSYMWFLVNKANASMTIGSSDHSITLDGKGTSYGINVTKREEQSNLTLKNVTFKNFRLTSAGFICASGGNTKNSGYIELDGITIDKCTTQATAFIDNQGTANDLLRLKGAFNITNSTGTAINTSYRIKLGDSNNIYNGFSANDTIKIKWGGTKEIDQLVVVKVPQSQLSLFDVTDSDYGLYWVTGGGDLKLAQAYTLNVTDAKAATLVLPYETRIPSGTSVYKLTHTNGADKATATAVETTLAKDTPVLVFANQGSYKFVCTSNDNTTKTSGSVTVGALTGQYENLTFTDDNKANIYILNKVDGVVGFYKAATGKKVGANRAYLTAKGMSGEVSQGARPVSIVFGDSETTGINAVTPNAENTIKDNIYYDLSGRRVTNPKRGLYIINGKKVLIK